MPDNPGLPVEGYQPQSQERVDLANQGKLIEELANRWIDHLVEIKEIDERDLSSVCDQRMVALCRTNLQQAFMWGIRSIFQPTRLDMSDEELDMRIHRLIQEWREVD